MLTRDNHLNAVYRLSPQKFSNMMIQLWATKKGRTLESLLASFPTREFDTDDEYTWDVTGSARRNIALLYAIDENGVIVDPTSDTMIGAGTAPFQLVFGEDYFADGEYIVGNYEEYQFRILGDARMAGTNAIYTVELAAGNINGVPAERLGAGEKFSIIAAFVENEMSRKVGDVRFASSVAMRNEFSHVRIQHKVPGNKLNKKVAVGVPVIVNNKPTTTNMWMHVVDFAVEEQFAEYKNMALAWGRSNRNENGEYTNIGKSGGVIKTGDGLFAQAAYGNVIPYNTFSLKAIDDALYYIVNGTDDALQHVIVMRTGRKGAEQFHRAVKQDVSGWTCVTEAAALGMIKKVSSPLHSTALSAGYMYTEYRSASGNILRVEVDPSYDDTVMHKVEHPLGGPAFSYRYDIWDLGTGNEPNIFKCTVKNEPEYRGYQWGPFRNPFTGGTNNPYASYDEDSAVIHKKACLGVCILDTTRVCSIVPAIIA